MVWRGAWRRKRCCFYVGYGRFWCRISVYDQKTNRTTHLPKEKIWLLERTRHTAFSEVLLFALPMKNIVRPFALRTVWPNSFIGHKVCLRDVIAFLTLEPARPNAGRKTGNASRRSEQYLARSFRHSSPLFACQTTKLITDNAIHIAAGLREGRKRTRNRSGSIMASVFLEIFGFTFVRTFCLPLRATFSVTRTRL